MIFWEQLHARLQLSRRHMLETTDLNPFISLLLFYDFTSLFKLCVYVIINCSYIKQCKYSVSRKYNTDHFIETTDLFLSGRVNRATALLLLEEMVSGNAENPTKVISLISLL